MDAVVVDTDVLSFALKGDSRAAAYEARLSGKVWVVSFMSVAELDRWALARNWGVARRQSLDETLKRFAVCYPNRDICRLWAEVSNLAARQGHPIACADAWTAAVARFLGLPLVTHNAGDFRHIDGLQLG